MKVICKVCGKEQDVSHYYEDVRNKLADQELCHECNFWKEKLEEDAKLPPHKACVINGTHYYIDDEDSEDPFRGFGGDKFTIRFKDGFEVTTTNLWCQGEISKEWRDKFPDNADFDWQWKQIGITRYLVPKI